MASSVASYRSTSPQGALESVDFSAVTGQSFAFFHLRDAAEVAAFKQKITAAPFRQEIVGTTTVAGKPVIIARSHLDSTQVIRGFAEQGDELIPYTKKPVLDAWRIRSILGTVGQLLQLASSFLRPETALTKGKGIWKRVDKSIFVFAGTNLTANGMNLMYNHGEVVEDKYKLNNLKQYVNRTVSPLLPGNVTPIDVADSRAQLRQEDKLHPFLENPKIFIERHSVKIGELGLRYLGALGLAFPAANWKTAFRNKTWPPRDASPLRVYTGLSSIAGKTVALTSKIPDPYNPEPRTWLDMVREKCTFLMGGLVEVTSFGTLAYDCFFGAGKKGGSRAIACGGKQLSRDWLGGIGAALFTIGYIVRSWAPFGVRRVDMKELYAHASDSLAQVPADKLPQLLVNLSANLSEHFTGRQHVDFAEIYTNIAEDMHRYHPAAEWLKAPTAPAEVSKPASVSHQKAPQNHIQITDAKRVDIPAQKRAIG